MAFLRFVIVPALFAVATAFAPPASRCSVLRSSAATSVQDTVRMMADEAPKEAKKAKKEKPPPKPRLPGEGDPFSSTAKEYGETIYAVPALQPRTISDGTVADRFEAGNYIENEDEPWHSTSRSVSVIGISQLEASKPANVKEAESTQKVKVGGDKPGWTDKRILGKTHDNSVA